MSPVSRAKQRQTAATVFAALGDETRLGLVARLQQGDELSLSELSSGVNLTRQAVAKHVGVLRNARLVRCRREGRETLVALQTAAVDNAAAYLCAVSAHWDAALGRLRQMVERQP